MTVWDTARNTADPLPLDEVALGDGGFGVGSPVQPLVSLAYRVPEVTSQLADLIASVAVGLKKAYSLDSITPG